MVPSKHKGIIIEGTRLAQIRSFDPKVKVHAIYKNRFNLGCILALMIHFAYLISSDKIILGHAHTQRKGMQTSGAQIVLKQVQILLV